MGIIHQHALTKPGWYPVPNIVDFNTTLAQKKIFSKLDTEWAYYQIPRTKDSIKKAARFTLFGLFEFVVILFGLKNGSATFQRFMDGLLRDLELAQVFLDDIMMVSTTEEEHCRHVRAVLQHFDEAGLVITPASVSVVRMRWSSWAIRSIIRGLHHQLIEYKQFVITNC